MRFRQLDSITEVTPGERIEAQRAVHGEDMYFNDHFPAFPVLPGALTTEAMVQACEWLTRKTDNFKHSVVRLSELRNVKFNGMVRPGQTLSVTADVKKWQDGQATFATKAFSDGEPVASARMTLEYFDIAERYPKRGDTDPWLLTEKIAQFDKLDPTHASHEPAPPTVYRWMWIDRFDAFTSGQRCTARKTVCIACEPVDLYMPYFPNFPPSLTIEGLAQAGGILSSERGGFIERVMLAKVGKATFHRLAFPGDTMIYDVELVDVSEDGAMVQAKSTIDGEPHVDAELMFAYIPEDLIDHDLLSPSDKCGMTQTLRLYVCGQTASGDPLPQPSLFEGVTSDDATLGRRA